jgi:dCTP deaminase
MILSDRDLRARIEKGDLVVDPLDDPDLQIQPASVDVRLGHEFLTFKTPHVSHVDPRDPKDVEGYTDEEHVPQGEPFVLHPGEFVLGTTYERVEIPSDLVARVEGRSSLGRLAIVVHATAGFIDPGFQGKITLELSNLGHVPVALRPRMRISQIVIQQLTSAAHRPYGSERASKYQDQGGPTASRLEEDADLRGE